MFWVSVCWHFLRSQNHITYNDNEEGGELVATDSKGLIRAWEGQYLSTQQIDSGEKTAYKTNDEGMEDNACADIVG